MAELRRLLLLLAVVAPGSAFASAVPSDAAAQEWRFRVMLDDREIGSHRYSVIEKNGEVRVESDARFSVKVLFVEAYRYVHEARERWRGDCLESIESHRRQRPASNRARTP